MARAVTPAARAVMGAVRAAVETPGMLERHAHWLFVIIGGMGCLVSLAMLADPTIGLGVLGGVGPDVPPGAEDDAFTAFVFRWTATAMFGSNVLTVLIALTAFRRGERWAGVALWYWPAMFVSHLVMYRWGPMSYVQILWLTLTIPVLAAHFARASRGPRSRAATAAVTG